MDAKKLIEQAVQHQRAGRLDEAEKLLDKVVRYQPTHEVAIRSLALLQHHTGRPQAAADTVRRAVNAEPANPHWREMLADLLLHSDPRAAEEAAREAVKLRPSHSPAMCVLGDALLAQGRGEEAIETFRLAVRLRPNHQFPRCRLAGALRQAGRREEAEAELREAAKVDPRSAEVRHALAAMMLDDAQRHDEAERELRAAIEANPDFLPAYTALASLLMRHARHAEAEQVYRDGLNRKASDPVLLVNLGHCLVATGRHEDAEGAYRHALVANPRLPAALVSLSSLLGLRGRLFESLAVAQQAVQANPNFGDAYGALGTALHSVGSSEEALPALNRAWQMTGSPAAGSNLLHALNYVTHVPPADVLTAHRGWAQRHTDSIAPLGPHRKDRNPDRRLRIGYVSPDFRGHAVSYFFEPLLAGHDRAQVEVFCYSAVGVPDAVTERLKSRADAWRNIVPLTDQQAAQQIFDDGIDILIDLAGHTNQHRLGVFAHRPAPVQVTYQGYPNTTGVSAIAYRLTDPFADPPGMTEHLHTEELVRLPRTAWCYQPPADAPDVADLPARRNGFVTFGSFNRISKISPIAIELWSGAVTAVPRARLVLKSAGLDEPAAQQYFRELFARHGLEGDRLVLLGSQPTFRGHLERYAEIDVALDAYPYHGTTTTCEAMWMGVPSIELVGPVHVSRVGLSLATNVGLGDFTAESNEGFIEIARRVAADIDRLAELRRTMRDRMRSSPLMDVHGFCREVEQAYRDMWRAWCEANEEF